MTVAKRREREREERRSAILAAAEKVFFAKGFAAATMDEVAGEAEVSKGTLYLYFKSKDDLFFAIASPMIDRTVERLFAIAQRDDTGIALVEQMLAAQSAIVGAHPQQFRIISMRMAMGFGDVDPDTESFAAHHARVFRVTSTYVNVIERGQRDGSIRTDLVAVETAVRLWASLQGILLMRINLAESRARMPLHIDAESLVSGHIAMVCEGLRPCLQSVPAGGQS